MYSHFRRWGWIREHDRTRIGTTAMIVPGGLFLDFRFPDVDGAHLESFSFLSAELRQIDQRTGSTFGPFARPSSSPLLPSPKNRQVIHVPQAHPDRPKEPHSKLPAGGREA
jgi:hypothetical protein